MNVFGKDITRYFYPHENGEPISIVTQTPTIYVFEDQPSREAAAAGTGAIATISSWTEDANPPYGRKYTIPAIDDPSPTSSAYSEEYWVAVNFKIATGEQTQTVIRNFEIVRVEATESLPRTRVQDLKDVYPAITSYLDAEKLGELISIAEDHVKIELESKGSTWEMLRDLDRLKLAIAYKAIWFSALSQVKSGDDKFIVRMREFEQLYSFVMNSLTLKEDKDRDGDAESVAKTNRTSVFNIK